MTESPQFLGIEIGGTKLQLGVARGDGSPLVDLERRDVDLARGAEGIRGQIADAGRQLLARHSVERVGFGFGGPVNHSSGCVIKSHQVDGWDDFPLVDWTRETFGLPAVLGNDCDCAALAEARFGAGRGAGIVFYVTVGTGIGGGLVIGGRVHGQGRPAVAEIGHLRPGPSATTAGNTVESLAAGPGIVQSARQFGLAAVPGGPWTAKRVNEAARSGDPAARAALAQAIRTLGWAIAQVVTLTAAEVVVVGGGVSLIGEEHFFQPLREEVANYIFPPLAQAYRVVPAALGEEVVVHGACAMAADTDA